MRSETETSASTGAAAPGPAAPPADSTGQREQVWRRERRGHAHRYGPVYRSGFLDAFLAGRFDDGGDLALAVGSHAQHYPFAHPRSRWDDLLIVAGEERLIVPGRRISALGIALGPGRRATIAYHGRALRARPDAAGAPAHGRSAAAVDVDLHLELDALVHHPRAQGIGFRGLVLGLQWQPALVTGSGSLSLDGRRRRIEHAAGLMERGSLTNLRGRLFEFGFESLVVCRATGEPAAYVRFAAAPLHHGLTGLPLRVLLSTGIVHEEITLSGPRPQHGDRLGLAPRAGEPETTLIRHHVELGPGALTTSLVAIGEAEPRYGLRRTVSRGPA